MQLKSSKSLHKFLPIVTLPQIKCWQYWGSRTICDPPPEDTDLDILALAWSEPTWWEVREKLGKEDWGIGGSNWDDTWSSDLAKKPYYAQWCSWRLDELNICLTFSEDFYNINSRANAEAKRLNVLQKKDRIALFELARRQNWIG